MRVLLVSVFVAIAGLLIASDVATAAPIELNSGDEWVSSPTLGEGGGRGIGVYMLDDFDLDSIGLEGDLQNLSFDVQVYASTNGSDAGSLLASSSATVGGTGFGWHDIAIDYNLQQGNYYVLHFRPTTDDANNWATGVGISYYNDSALPVEIDGTFRLINGEAGYAPPLSFGNFLHPNLRVNGVGSPVPEPSSVALLALGATGLFVMRRRARRS